MQTKFAGMLEVGDVIALEGSTIAVEGVQEVEGVIMVWGLWEGVWGRERTTFPYAADAEVRVR